MENITIQKFYIAGISARTTNQNGQASEDIEALWERFWSEDIQNKIPNKTSNEIYAVYTDYESDLTGFYTTIIGMSVDSLENIPEGFVGIIVEADSYEKFVSKGKMPKAVVETWLEIWADQDLNSRRAYNADFTIHGKKYYDGDNAEVETYLSIK
ncbi:GyrI-like domain-containing protein [Sphingobacterium sp.]|uniref:GyrI-like domain-containing protein n=1 Tax=Sphingobacterium sp. TaxID=341027 RepID=UPI002583DE6C|nr:GyrI-like domain-containing protein [Sphingobacterium sp.]WET67860.1 MAG: GyrI-like domain-containing protein [Sphingobacterium sp.]